MLAPVPANDEDRENWRAIFSSRIEGHETKCDFKKSSNPAMIRSIMIYRAICHLNLCGHFFKPLSISSTKSLVGYYWAVVHSTDYGHTKAKSLILCGPNSNLNPEKKFWGCGYKDLVFCRNNG